MAQSKNEFYLRRLHSLVGVIPIGAFLIVHLMVNHQATQGAEAFNRASGFMESLPFLIVMEFILIYIPLLYHGLFGLHIAFTAKENIGHYSLFRNWMFFFQRVSGILAFVFIAMHLWQTRLQKAFYGKSVDYNLMHETLQHPLCAIILQGPHQVAQKSTNLTPDSILLSKSESVTFTIAIMPILLNFQ